MSLRFVHGRAGSGKTRQILSEIGKRIEEKASHPLVLIVPEQFTFQTERDLIALLQAGGILQTEVLSFQRMAFRIFNEAGGITYPHIHPAGKAMILYRILDRMKGQFRLFSRISEREGFVGTLQTLITEFKRYSVTPGHLEKAGQELPEGNPLRDKLLELCLVYAEYERVLASRYRDSDDDLTLASRKLAETDLYEGAEIWIDGFTNFTPQEYIMIEQLMKKAKTLTISLCTDSIGVDGASVDTDVFAPVKRAVKKLVKIARENGCETTGGLCLEGSPPIRFRKSPELAHLERNLLAYPYEIWPHPTGSISLFSATGIFSEVEAVARDILRLCREEGMRYRDMAVITRNLAGYERLVQVIFAQYDIPCFIDRKVDIHNHPLVRMILSMLEIFQDNWSYESVFRYLKTGLAGIPEKDMDILENYVMACGIRGSQWTSDQMWRGVPDFLPDERSREANQALLEEVNRIRREVVKPLAAFRQGLKGRNTAASFCAGLYDFLLKLGVPEAIEAGIQELAAQGELAMADEYSQVWNSLMEVLDQMVEVMGDEAFSLERFSKLLAIGLAEYQIGLIPASLDQVMVMSVERSKNHDIRVLYLLGANDGVFPSAAVKEGLLSDQDRQALSHMGLELAADTRTQAFDEQFLVYKTLSSSGGYVKISWPIADSEGKTMRPSSILPRLRKLFPHILERSNILPPQTEAEELEWVEGPVPAFGSLVARLRQKADGALIHPLWESVFRWYQGKAECQDKIRSALMAFQYRNKVEPIDGEKLRALYGDPVVSSVSRLEKYTACPFSFYVQYGLGAADRKVYRLSPPDIGTFMHAIIERFSKMVSEGPITWRSFDRDWCNRKVSEIVEEMLRKMEGSGLTASKRYTALALRLKRVVSRAVWLIAQHIRMGSFNPLDYEVGFGRNEKYPPIVIELDSGVKVSLSGRVDRVDALKTPEGTYLRIIDYKSGTKDFRLSDVYYGLQIQLITYMDALWEGTGEGQDQAIHPGGMLYFKIDDPLIPVGTRATEEEVEAAILRKLKMKGLLLADVKLIREMDRTIDGSSMILPATVNKGDVLGRNTSGATMDQFKSLRVYVKRLLKGMCAELMRGNVAIRPCRKKGFTACANCSFLSVCQFDPSLGENGYRLLHDKKDEDVWGLMSSN